jgi:hypothetical protein
MRPEPAEGVDEVLGRLAVFGQHHALALGRFEQLDHDRRAAGDVEQVTGVLGRVGKGGDRRADAAARQNLMRQKLVARGGDRFG